MKKSLINLLSFIFFGTLLILVFILVTSKSPLVAQIRSFVVLSGSMEPEMPVGSVVFSQRTGIYEVGDIISFDKQGVTITHRIVDIKYDNGQTKIYTRGDANNTEDSGSINESQIIGKRVFQIPYIGYLISFVRTIPGFFLFLALPGLIFILLEFKAIKEELEKEILSRVTNNSQYSNYTNSGFEIL